MKTIYTGYAKLTACLIALALFATSSLTAQTTLIGTTQFGGAGDLGYIFELDPSTDQVTSLYEPTNPTTEGRWFQGGLTKAYDGMYYGTSTSGGSAFDGVIYQYDPYTQTYTVVHEFVKPNGSFPNGALALAGNGKLYGVTRDGGTNSLGTLFEFDPAGGTHLVLHDFAGTAASGSLPYKGVIMINGILYGTTSEGGQHDDGTIYQYNIGTGTFTTLFSFDNGNDEGSGSRADLHYAGNGLLYGVCTDGGDNDEGTMFSFDPATLTFNVLHQFSDLNDDGESPFSGLTEWNGRLYTMTEQGGDFNDGAIMMHDIASGNTNVVVTDIQRTTEGEENRGNNLVDGGNGYMYTMTSEGGSQDEGTIGKYDPVTQSYMLVHSFTDDEEPEYTNFAYLWAPVNESKTVDLCFGDSLLINGVYETTAGPHTDTIFNPWGADVIQSITLNFIAFHNKSHDVHVCTGDSFFLSGTQQIWVHTAGPHADTFIAVGGCDSFVSITVNFDAYSRDTMSMEICEDENYFFAGVYYNTSGIWCDTLTSIGGCDSVVCLDLTVKPNDIVNATASICAGDQIFLGGALQNSAGTYYDTTTAANGCLRVTITVLTVISPVSSGLFADDTATICFGDSIEIGGIWRHPSSSQRYSFTLTKASFNTGCDSIVTTYVEVIGSLTGTVFDTTICEGETFVWQGKSYDTDGFYIDTLTSSLGCDSFAFLNLTVVPFTTSNLFVDICEGDSFEVNGVFYKTSGVYNDTIVDSDGCEQVIAYNLTVLPNTTIDIDVIVCPGDSAFLVGAWRTTAGTYTDINTSSNGCTEFTNYHLSFGDLMTDATIVLCDGDYYITNVGDTLDMSGMYTDTFTAYAGCDSIINLTVNVVDTNIQTFTIIACPGDTVDFGFPITGDTVIYDTTFGSGGCIVVDIYDIFFDVFYTDIDVHICQGEFYFAGGAFQATSGVYTDTYQAIDGCDSVVTTYLTVTEINTEVVRFGFNNATSMELGNDATFQWINCNDSNKAVAGDTLAYFVASVPGDYACVIWKDGCVDTTECISFNPTGIDNIAFANSIEAFPNPTSGMLQLTFGEVWKEIEVTVTNLNGQVVSSEQFLNRDRAELDLGEYASGIYFVEVKTATNQATIKVSKVD